MNKAELVDVIFDYMYSGNYHSNFLNHDEYLKELESNRHDKFIALSEAINDSDKHDEVIKKYIIHKENPFAYYYDNAEDALKKDKNPRKALFIINHILSLQNSDEDLSLFFIFMSQCYTELHEYQLVIYFTDQILNKYQANIKNDDIDGLYHGFLKLRINARIELNQFELAINDCKKFLNLIEIVTGEKNTIFASDVFALKAKIYEKANDELNKSIAEQTAKKISDEYFGFDKLFAGLV